jgi:hypothetical protein
LLNTAKERAENYSANRYMDAERFGKGWRLEGPLGGTSRAATEMT